MLLTSNQKVALQEMQRLSSVFPLLILQGNKGMGKHSIIEKFLEGKPVVQLDLCAMSLELPLRPENFYSYIKSILEDNSIPLGCCLQHPRGILYIRHWDRVKEILEDYGIRNRYFPRYVLSRLVEDGIQLIISSESEIKIDTASYWTIRLKLERKDTVEYLERHFTPEETRELLPLVSKASLESLEHARRFSEGNPKKFREAITYLTGSRLEIKERIPEVVPKINLIGLEAILEAIDLSIIGPMKDASGEIPLKKGIVLSGPPGTGKTSIGRWLAHQIQGKLYLVDGTSGVNGNTFIESVNHALEQAAHNGPAVVFIDDVDLIFEYADTYRSFLTLLDGIESKSRSKVCVIVTCMDISKIPSSLIRGGRLELCLETQLPSNEARMKILQAGWNRIKGVIEGKGRRIEDLPLEGVVRRTAGWNCADLNRYIEDLLRGIVYRDPKKYSIEALSGEIISLIKRQYTLVRRPEDKAEYNQIYS